ncbi:MAG: response regulator [Pseudomonadota bacterium]
MAGEGLKILVVDDESGVRRIISKVLLRNGYQPIESADGREALEVFRNENPAIVITDIRMPDMDGLELLTRIKEKSPETCIAIMTGYGSEEVAIKALRNGASNYFKKPIDLPELIYAIGVLSDSIRSRRHNKFDYKKLAHEIKTIIIENDLDSIYSIVHELTKVTAYFSSDVESIQTGLLEMITNAVEHGNLNITYEEKQKALQKGTLKELYKNRAQTVPYKERKVTIRYEFNPEKVMYTICDQGDGFGWRDLPDSADPDNLMAASGRGVFMTRLYMDEVVYNDTGNEVTIVKYLQPRQV